MSAASIAEPVAFLPDEQAAADEGRPVGVRMQMCTVRYVGRFLVDDPLNVPWSVVEHLSAQLRIEDPPG
nr:DUF4158 domain-containing protein [Frankia sp. Cas3]